MSTHPVVDRFVAACQADARIVHAPEATEQRETLRGLGWCASS